MRDIRSALDDLLGVLAPGHSLILRSTIAPGHDRVRRRLPAPSTAAFRSARRCSSRTRPSGSPPGASSPRSTRCRASSAASARAPARSRPSCSACSTRRSCRRTPVQAELAKIWANILRYTNFALPNLLMMDCERYGANVFEVIDLINRDYPRGGIAQPGLHGRAPACARTSRSPRSARPHRGCCSPSPASTSRCRCSCSREPSAGSAPSPTAASPCSASPSRPTPTTSATRWRTS